MAGRTLDIEEILSPEQLASHISENFDRWRSMRSKKDEQWMELRNYVFATDTKTTTNAKLPWKNSTTIPKLCQIRDNLHANYMAALFPNENWLRWEGSDEEGESKQKRVVIENYMKNKLRESEFRTTVSQLVYDYIDFGNMICTAEFVNESHTTPDGEVIPGYIGPKARRISPFDIVFNPLAADFKSSPKIIRTLKTFGELAKDIEDRPELGYEKEILDVITNRREHVAGLSAGDVHQNQGYQLDGFGSMLEYLQSGYVEILEFYGDLYDVENGELLSNHVITIVDRATIIRKQPISSWLGESPFRHAGWRLRPDNLWAMGPLDNLVGMQYRIDHLENLKADVFDLIAHPVMKVRGEVEDFEYGPGARIYLGDEGDVGFERPDATALNANTEIAVLENKMEEMAGAPRQAMGIRTPGEKTKFEVQTLENASSRIFQNKINYFEEKGLTPLLNLMLELGRRNLNDSDLIRVLDDQEDVVLFERITKEDITAAGKLRPVGASHFARRANQLQNITQLSNTPVMQNPAVQRHFSGLKLAQLIEDLADIEKFGIVEENIAITEEVSAQQAAQEAAPQPQPTGAPIDPTAAPPEEALPLPPQGP